MKPKISLILPAYNVAAYISKCLDTCLAQDLGEDEYEIIIVNDGSTDETPRIIAEYAQRHPAIKIVTQSNQGLSMARNNGVKVAKGEYIWFVDSDDLITRNSLASVVKVMESEKLNAFCVGPSIPFREDFPFDFFDGDYYHKSMTGREFMGTGKFVVGAWCYVFERKFWQENGFEFYPGIAYEDTQLMPWVISHTPRISGLSQFSIYSYIQRAGSIMNSAVTPAKLRSHAVIVNTSLDYADRAEEGWIKTLMENSAINAYMSGMKAASTGFAGGGTSRAISTFTSQVKRKPKALGKSMSHKAYRLLALRMPQVWGLMMKVAHGR